VEIERQPVGQRDAALQAKVIDVAAPIGGRAWHVLPHEQGLDLRQGARIDHVERIAHGRHEGIEAVIALEQRPALAWREKSADRAGHVFKEPLAHHAIGLPTEIAFGRGSQAASWRWRGWRRWRGKSRW